MKKTNKQRRLKDKQLNSYALLYTDYMQKLFKARHLKRKKPLRCRIQKALIGLREIDRERRSNDLFSFNKGVTIAHGLRVEYPSRKVSILRNL